MLMPKSSLRGVRLFDVLVGMLHILLVSLLSIKLSFDVWFGEGGCIVGIGYAKLY